MKNSLIIFLNKHVFKMIINYNLQFRLAKKKIVLVLVIIIIIIQIMFSAEMLHNQVFLLL